MIDPAARPLGAALISPALQAALFNPTLPTTDDEWLVCAACGQRLNPTMAVWRDGKSYSFICAPAEEQP